MDQLAEDFYVPSWGVPGGAVLVGAMPGVFVPSGAVLSSATKPLMLYDAGIDEMRAVTQDDVDRMQAFLNIYNLAMTDIARAVAIWQGRRESILAVPLTGVWPFDE